MNKNEPLAMHNLYNNITHNVLMISMKLYFIINLVSL